MKRYAIWNKQDQVITPVGEVLSAAQWIARYPVAGIASIKVVCAIEDFEDAANTPSTEPTTEERTAAALETIAAGTGKETTSAVDALLGEDE